MSLRGFKGLERVVPFGKVMPQVIGTTCIVCYIIWVKPMESRMNANADNGLSGKDVGAAGEDQGRELDQKPKGKRAVDSAKEERKSRPGLVALRLFIKRNLRSPEQREEFAKRCGTTLGHLRQVASGDRNIAVWLAINLDKESGGTLDMRELVWEEDPSHAIKWDYVMSALYFRMGNLAQDAIKAQAKLELLQELRDGLPTDAQSISKGKKGS